MALAEFVCGEDLESTNRAPRERMNPTVNFDLLCIFELQRIGIGKMTKTRSVRVVKPAIKDSVS